MKNTKKGFTLVELLIVIAIIAILATVSVVGYTKFIEKANLSNDQQTISMINKNLQAEFAAKKPASAGEAMTALGSLGFIGDKFTAYSEGFHYAYNLEENQFYLLDANNKAVFPNATTEANLWGLYNDSANAIPGITKYVATKSITDARYFNDCFGTGSFTIDLNSYVLSVDNANKANITLLNGFATETGFKNNGGDDEVKVMEEFKADKIVVDNASGVATVEEVVISHAEGNVLNISAATGATEVVFKNCVFLPGENVNQDSPIALNNVKAEKVVIENCTFVGAGKWSVSMQYNNTVKELVIKNNQFINCARGINIQEGTSADLKLTVEGNTFQLTGGNDMNKGNAIQIATDAPFASLTIKDNTFVSGNAVLCIHAGIGKREVWTVESANGIDIVCSGNTIDSNIKTVVADPDAEKDSGVDGKAKIDSIVEALKGKVK